MEPKAYGTSVVQRECSERLPLCSHSADDRAPVFFGGSSTFVKYGRLDCTRRLRDKSPACLWAPVAGGKGETVLVAEDDVAVRGLVAEGLAEANDRVLQAESGDEGLAVAARAGRLDLLVIDVGLPGLNSRQLADALRATRGDLKVLFITGYAEGAAAPSGFLDPGMAMITKPFVPRRSSLEFVR